MDKATFERLLDEWGAAKLRLSQDKGADYAERANVLANFERMHKICRIWGINPSLSEADVYAFYIVLKLDRLFNLLHSGTEPSNESLDDTMQDLSLYIDLMRAYL